MKTVHCPNCGTPVEGNQRFCRKCGQPINFSEATTRTLDPPSVFEQTTQHINSMPTTPAYYHAGAAPPAPETKELRAASQKRMMVIMASLIGVLAVALIVLAVIASNISRSASAEQPAMARPQTQPPSGRQMPPLPPAAAQPPVPQTPLAPRAPSATAGDATTISREMVYPGAKITTEINRSKGGSVIQFQSEDSFDKVVDWYKAKLNPAKVLKTAGPTAILQGEGMTAVINSAGDGVNVFLKKE